MTIEITGSVLVKSPDIEFCLQQADFRYPRYREAEQFAGWTKTPVIPALYNWTVQHRRLPLPNEGVAFLMNRADPGTNTQNTRIIRRAQKLYMDFCREMHVLGLLQGCPLFGYIQYQKSLDISYNVDFVAALLLQLGGKHIGIQSAMRARWIEKDPYEEIKKKRRKRRGALEWKGKLYWLTNRDRPPSKKISGCWLFGPAHINDLANKIRGNKENKNFIGIQTKLF
jgi:hypothetical protein